MIKLRDKLEKENSVKVVNAYGGVLFEGYFCLSIDDVKKLKVHLDEFLKDRRPKDTK